MAETLPPHSTSKSHAGRIVVDEGLRFGLLLSACVAVLAFLGLSPAGAWIPEVLLVGGAILLPLGAFGMAGYRAAARSDHLLAGASAGSLAGAISGTVGGLMYLLFGKPALNILVGFALGAVGGAVVGGFGGWLNRRQRIAHGASSVMQGRD